MVYISHEDFFETESRLLNVMRSVRLTVYSGTYAFLEFPLTDFPDAVSPRALALVQDNEIWSQIVPCDNEGEELFGLFRLNFPPNIDNSGFVGWLGTRLKRKFGTGVFVVCGQNKNAGGIFDYWGVPSALADAVITDVKEMIAGG